jgi:ATP-dependent DNA helicase DinG
MLSPIEFGMPEKFVKWRPGQVEAVDEILRPDRRIVIICAPTGFGKSPMYMAAAKMSGLRTVVCTSTKGLQDQLHADFSQMSVDLRGQSNYECKRAHEFGLYRTNPLFPITADMGPCHNGAGCESKYSGECEYYGRYMAAREADIVVTNYAMWMHDARKSGDWDVTKPWKGNLKSMRPVEMLILDEAHDAVEELSGFVGTELKYREITRAKLDWIGGEEQDRWQTWAKDAYVELFGRLEKVEKDIKRGDHKHVQEAGRWRRLMYKVEKVKDMQAEWAIEEDKTSWEAREYGPRVRFDPLWPVLYAESVLFRGVKKIVLVSATVRPKTAELLGIQAKAGLTGLRGDGEGASFREFASTFPLERRPVIHVPTVQMNWRTSDFDLMMWIQAMDRIMDGRPDRKGIIHTVSYDRATLIRDNSRHSSRMLLHGSSDRAEVVKKFKASSQPTILVSPSVHTGYDFPYTECEFQIIAKLPFADNRGKVAKARIKADREYANYQVAQTLVQTIGRGMRAEDDQCETFIVDDNVKWFVGQNSHHFPKWMLDSYYTVNRGTLPNPLPKLMNR